MSSCQIPFILVVIPLNLDFICYLSLIHDWHATKQVIKTLEVSYKTVHRNSVYLCVSVYLCEFHYLNLSKYIRAKLVAYWITAVKMALVISLQHFKYFFPRENDLTNNFEKSQNPLNHSLFHEKHAKNTKLFPFPMKK